MNHSKDIDKESNEEIVQSEAKNLLDEYDNDGNYIGDDSAVSDSNSETESNDYNYCLLWKQTEARKQFENNLVQLGLYCSLPIIGRGVARLQLVCILLYLYIYCKGNKCTYSLDN